jgi:hypothetical protein
MTTTQAKKKIAAARQMTAANQDKHRIHLERGYVYASGIIWAINSESKLVRI